MADETKIDPDLIGLTGAIVATYTANNSVHAGDVPKLIGSVYAALSGLGASAVEAQQPVKAQGAVSARRSLGDPAHILSMIDGKPYQTLKRHIGKYGYTPESYRQAFGLPRDYPMVASGYAEKRSALARTLGLGRKKATPAPEPAATPARRSRKKALGDALTAAKGHLGGA